MSGPRKKVLARLTAVGVAALVAVLLPLSLCSAAVSWTVGGKTVCDTAGDQLYPRAVSDGGTGTISVWLDKRTANNAIYAQRLNSSGTSLWGATGKVVCDAVGEKYGPSICGDGAGGAIVVWQEKRDTVWDIYAQRINSSGTRLWAASGAYVEPFNVDMKDPALVSDGAGGAIFAFQGNGMEIANRLDGTGAGKWFLGMKAGNGTSAPAIESDGKKGAYVVWQTGTQMWANHFNTSGGEAWNSASGLQVTTAANVFMYDGAICTDNSGGVIFAWRDQRSGKSKIYAERVINLTINSTSAGAVLWTLGGKIVADGVNDQMYARLSTDTANKSIVTWSDMGAHYDVYAQKLDSSGNRTWGTTGRLITTGTATSDQRYSIHSTDGAGGAFFEYIEGGGGVFDLIAGRINSAGTVLWKQNISDKDQTYYNSCYQTPGSMVYVGSNKAVAVWSDNRGDINWFPETWTGEGIYAQQLY